MNNALNNFINILRKDGWLTFSISLGTFLFILFFQPFQLDTFDFDNRVVLVAGLGLIVFLLTILFRNIIPWSLTFRSKEIADLFSLPYIRGFIIFALNSVAFAFYLSYVGSLEMSFYIMSKIFLISLIAPVVLNIYDVLNDLKLQNESLRKENEVMKIQIKKQQNETQDQYITFYSTNSTHQLKLLNQEIFMMKSAENYVEIVYQQSQHIKKELIRNTLKNIERQLAPYANFVRCHRTYIINKQYIEKLYKKYNTHWLMLKGTNLHIPVSRQYLLQVKKSL